MNKEDLKIVFLGTPDFAVESLDALVKDGFNVAAVVTATDKPAGRGHKMLKSAVKQYAEQHQIPVLQPEKLKNPDFLEQLRSIGADLFVVIAFRMLPEAVWRMPRLGTFNLHASLLPKYRGAAPINWAVINGDAETGVTTFFLSHEIDTGDVIARERIEILPDDCVGDVHDRLMHLGARLTLNTVRDILNGSVKTIPQDQIDGGIPTPAPKIFRDTCRIDLTRPAREVHNLVRGLSPYPAAWTELSMQDGSAAEAKVFKTKVTEESSDDTTRGKVFQRDGRLMLGASDCLVEVLELQPSGKRRMEAQAYLRGARLLQI